MSFPSPATGPDVPPDGGHAAPMGEAPAGSATGKGRRLLVISHAAVVSVNQEVYRELARRGWDVQIVLPDRWRHSYAEGEIAPQALPGMEQALRPTRVAFPGRPQRHVYLTRPGALIRRAAPHVAFIEAEPFALPAAQWGFALHRAGIPFGVQCYENIDRALPAPVRALRSRVLAGAAFVAARSETAAGLARAWGASGEIGFAPPAIPLWADVRPHGGGKDRFTIGYAGRLVEVKGLLDLLASVRAMRAPVELLLIGNGELRRRLEGQELPGGSRVEVLDSLNHETMPAGYARLDVLVLPSHTTPTWKEQFGRVIVEALWCGVPVVGSDSGEIPWLIGLTGGGLTFPEGDVVALTERLERLRSDPALRERLAGAGRASAERLVSVPAAADPLEGMLLRAAQAGLPAASRS